MANEIRTGIKLEGDASGLNAAWEQGKRGAKEFRDQVDDTTNSSAKLGDSFKKVLSSLSGWAAGGPGQLAADSMGNISSIVDLLPGKLGLVATAVIAVASAFNQAHAETERQANALLLTGNYAGLVSGQLNDMARTAAAGTNASVGNVRQVMEGLVATGQVTTQSLAEMARGVELVTRFSGRSRESVVSDFTSMGNGVASWAAKHNESYHFITYNQYKYIEALEKAGSTQEAMRVTSEALSQHLGGDLTRNMGLLEKSWNSIRNVASKAWDAMLNVGRDETIQDKISKITAQLDALANRKTTGRYTESQRSELVATLQAQLETAQESERLARRAADNQAQGAREDAAKIAADRDKKKEGSGGHFADNFINNLITQYASLSDQMSKTEEVTRKLDTSSEKFTGTQRKEALNWANLIDQRTNANKVSQSWIKYLQQQEQMQQAANDAFTANVIGLGDQSREYEFQLGLLGKTSEQVDRLTAARRSQLALEKMLLDNQRALDSGAITEQDALEREAALRQEANKALSEQLGLMSAVEGRRRDMTAGANDALLDYERTAARVGDSTGNAIKSGFKQGEDAILEFAKTGKAEMASFANSVIADLLRIQIQQRITGPAAGMLGGVGGFSFTDLLSGRPQGYEYGPPAPSAQGNIYASPGLHGYANTIVSRPTLFAFAQGVGLMGEKSGSPGEAIMPLTRMSGGDLGVKVADGGTPQITVNVYPMAGETASVTQKQTGQGLTIDVVLRQVEEALASNVSAGTGPLARAAESRWGLRTAVN